MSKKKRNRRPASPVAHASTHGAPVSGDAVDASADGVTDDAAEVVEVGPVVDAALAQAAAMAGGGADPDDAPTADAAPAGAPASVRMVSAAAQDHATGDIRGVLIQIGGGRLLLPNATIAEVLSYAPPEPDADGAEWLLGRFRWRGWQIPLVAFSRLSGIGEDRPGLGSKVIVLKALGGERRLPFFAIVTQGFPRLVTVSRSALGVESEDEPLPAGVQALVRLNGEPALLPDLLHIERCLHELRDAA